MGRKNMSKNMAHVIRRPGWDETDSSLRERVERTADLWTASVPLRVDRARNADRLGDRLGGHGVSGLAGLRSRDLQKRCFDLVVALALIVALAPGMALIALAIRLTSPGPILFRQKRYGFQSRQFEILKFRTMFVADTDQSGVKQTRENDPRVTPLGRFLRRSSLDELPQLFNVVKGDMSLVGPRPHVPGMLAGGMLYEELVPYYFERHRMRPGITGLAQVNGFRGSTEDPVLAKARIDHDLAYADHWSLDLDLRIIARTAYREFVKGSGI